jgi:hypothetical protein
MMLSQIRLGNHISSNNDHRSRGNSEIIKGFDMVAFKNMELEYEHSYFNHPYESNTNEKLANICCNIIVNDNFNKKDDTDYLISE